MAGDVGGELWLMRTVDDTSWRIGGAVSRMDRGQFDPEDELGQGALWPLLGRLLRCRSGFRAKKTHGNCPCLR